MTEEQLVAIEIAFNVAYLTVIWALVLVMFARRDVPATDDQRVARLARWAFLLLAAGDTGHVGFRVLAYARGSLDATATVLGRDVPLVGLGALATAVTVTLFYVLVLAMWHERFQQPYGVFGGFLLAAAAVRLALMLPGANDWGSPVPPQPWSIVRNAPLTVLGLGTAWLIIRDARAIGDRAFEWIGLLIVVSYACYVPVILYVQRAPWVGMLMIPKTLAYVAIAVVVFAEFYRTGARVAAAEA